jgi:hypothetical protein
LSAEAKGVLECDTQAMQAADQGIKTKNAQNLAIDTA